MVFTRDKKREVVERERQINSSTDGGNIPLTFYHRLNYECKMVFTIDKGRQIRLSSVKTLPHPSTLRVS